LCKFGLSGKFEILCAIAFAPRKAGGYDVFCMSTITAILEPEADGTLHLPVPAELRSKKIKVVATLEVAIDAPAPEEAACPQAERGYIGKSPITGLPVWVSPPGSPIVTSEQVRKLLEDFP
jgi:hypothetical protein